MGLLVTPLKADDVLHDAMLTVHDLCAQTLADSLVVKLIENQDGVVFAQSVSVQQQA
ncbi:MAG TPA: hypothetical protein VNY35_12650 [Solirubrobacteraceae bacterium]|jgi:hypothetical protein|nr:hypothetical protein [Solirubrobacteraceae bacterium]